MDDTIRRQAAIDTIIAEGRTVDSRYLESERVINESDAVEALSMLPSARPEPRWIPVTERLPEVGKRVLVTVPLLNGYPRVWIAWRGTPMHADKVCFYIADSEWGDYEIREVTAWMPLPKPYERSE